MPKMGISKNTEQASAGLADALFSTTQQRVLALLFGQPDRSFYASEIIKLAGSGSGSVQRELARLARSGLVSVTRIGRQKHYQANPDSPVYDELCAIVQKTVGLVGPIREALSPVSKDIKLAFIYGSVAKREDTASSDIDLMIVSDRLTYGEVFGVLENVTGKLQRAVNPTVYSESELRKRIRDEDGFVKRVLSQPKLWVIGSTDDLPTG